MASFVCFLVLLSWCVFHPVKSNLVGGITPIVNKDFKDHPELLKGLDVAAAKVKVLTNDNSDRKYGYVASSLHVGVKIVQGFLYYVKADLGPSNCSLQDTSPILECAVDASDPRVQACSFNVWSRPWLPDKGKRLLIQNLKCSPKSPGG